MSTKYIFSVSPGRSGSHYLSKMFACIKDCHAYHEEKPVGNGTAMKFFLDGDHSLIKKKSQEKADIIKGNVGEKGIYVETNHCFIKGFGWYLPEFLGEENIGVIILRRSKEKVVSSTHRIGCRPLYELGRRWLITPDISRPIVDPPTRYGMSAKQTYKLFQVLNYPFSGVQPFAAMQKMLIKATDVLDNYRPRQKKNGVKANSSVAMPKTKENRPCHITPSRSITDYIQRYELECIDWYYEETYAMCEKYMKAFPQIRFYKASIEELNDFDHVKKMLDYFGLEEKSSLTQMLNKPTNVNVFER